MRNIPTLAVDCPDLTVVSLGPGWVKTDMGGANANITPPESVSGLLQVVQNPNNLLIFADDRTYTDLNLYGGVNARRRISTGWRRKA